MPQQDGISALRCNTYAGNHPRTIGLSGSNHWCAGPEVQWLALTAVVVRMDSLFWAEITSKRTVTPQTACANTSMPQQDGVSALKCNGLP